MRLPARIVVPVAAALLVVGGFIALLFTQLEGTRAMLSQQLTMALGSGSLADYMPTVQITPDSGEESLINLRRGDMYALRGQWAEAGKEYQNAVDEGGGLTALRKLAQDAIAFAHPPGR